MAEAPRDASLDDRVDPAITLVPWNAAWSIAAASELRRIEAAIGAAVARAEHVGSTSVEGLVAKPIIDLQLSIACADRFDDARRGLEVCGYTYIPDGTGLPYWLFVRPMERPRTHHVHVCLSGSRDEHRHVAVRDLLRASSSEREAYGSLKRSVMRSASGDRLAYIAGKEAYMRELERRAVAWLETQAGMCGTRRARDQ